MRYPKLTAARVGLGALLLTTALGGCVSYAGYPSGDYSYYRYPSSNYAYRPSGYAYSYNYRPHYYPDYNGYYNTYQANDGGSR
jgi:hypothetical protein